MEDKEILILFTNEPAKALGFIFDKYIDYLSKEVFFILRNEEETEDVIQDLFLELWNNQKYLKNINTSLKYYLKKAAINRAINKIKKQKRFESVEIEEMFNKEVKLSDQLEMDELNLEIKNAIDLLPNKCRTVFILSRYDEMSYKEISRKLDISVKTVENQISKALKILREKIKNE